MARVTSARMRRGTKATRQGRAWPTQGADTWQEATRCTRVHADARVGRHVAKGGWQLEGPRVSGPWLGDWGGNANALPHPTFYTYDFHFFLSCGTMSHTFLTFCKRRSDTAGVGCGQDSGDRVDPSPRDHQINTLQEMKRK